MSYAAKHDQPGILEYLLEQGAKPGRENPLSVAVSEHNPGCLKILVDHNYSVRAFDKKHTYRPLIMIATQACYLSWESEDLHETIKILLDNGASLEQHEEHGWTPLHLVAMQGDERTADFIRFLLKPGSKPGSNIEAKDNLGRTALHWATQIDNEPLMELLLEEGANKEASNNKGNTPLLHTIDENGKITTLRWLLDHGANPNAQNHQGLTPLMLASRRKQADKVKALLMKGARLTVKDKSGSNGLHYIFEHLPATEAESIVHQFSHLITQQLLSTTNSWGKYPVELIREKGFKWFIEGLAFPVAREAALRDARQRQDYSRLQLLEAIGRSRP